VVATRAGGVEEIVEDGVTGVLVPPGNPDALAVAVRGLLADRGRADRIARAGRACAEARFSVDAMVHGMTRYMEEVVRS
jgi:glycosyltransferase involved in cell wall biosynthesis